MSITVIHNASILPFGKESVLSDGAVAWDKKGIIELGPSKSIMSKYSHVNMVDAGGRMVTPGLINLHYHLYSTLARGLSPIGPPPTTFPEILSSLWWKWDKCLDLNAVQLSALLGLLSCLSCGVTTVFDHHSSPNAVTGSLDTIAEAYREVGLKGSLCYEVSDRDGNGIKDQAIKENLEFAQATSLENNGKLTAHFGLHANFTLSQETLQEVADAISRLDVGIHIHMAEDNSDNEAADSHGFIGPVTRLNHFGLLNDRSLLIHGVHLRRDQWNMIRHNHAHVIHNPGSNLNNAVGIAPVNEMLINDVSMGLGTDGYSPQMLTTMNLAQLAAKHRRQDSKHGNWAISLLTEANPRIASAMLYRTVGILSAGAAADVVLWDYIPPTPVDENTVPAHLTFGLQYAKPIHIWIDGEMIWENGESLNVDVPTIAIKARKRVPELWRKYRE